MKSKLYWQNKICYALAKIDYAKSRITGSKNINERSKIYSTIMHYGGKVSLDAIMTFTKLDKGQIIDILQEMKVLGVVRWDGRIGLKKPVMAQSDKTVFEYVKNGVKEKVIGLGFDYDGAVIHPLDVAETKQKPQTETQADNDWVEIKYSNDVIIKTKKSAVKQRLLQ